MSLSHYLGLRIHKKLYEKHVPATVRDDINETADEDNPAKNPKKQQRG